MTSRERLRRIRRIIDDACEDSIFDERFKPSQVELRGSEVEKIYRLCSPARKRKGRKASSTGGRGRE